MITINLVHSESSNIPYQISRFPDGEIKITLGEFSRKEFIAVDCRICNAEDLMLVAQVADILDRHAVNWNLYIYYLMSMRMDRVMTFNDPFNLKIVASVLNKFGAENIFIYHPHSNNSFKLIKNSKPFENGWHKNAYAFCSDAWQVCFPDEGAFERYASYYDFAYTPLVCEKIRDVETGKITNLKIQNIQDYVNKPIMVIDDLCDAGGTFIMCANALRSIDPHAYLGISVIHMVNYKGIENLSSTYDEVYFTNTYKDWDNLPIKCQMYKVIP